MRLPDVYVLVEMNRSSLFPIRGRSKAHRTRRLRVAAAGIVTLLCAFPNVGARAQAATGSAPAAPDQFSQSPRAWADVAAANQVRMIQADHEIPLRYRIRKIDARGDNTRDVIESRDGTIARVVQRHGVPLTAEEEATEREPLNDILRDPEPFLQRHPRERAGTEYALELVRALPGAMLWTFAPGQPPLPHPNGKQLVLDFQPDPKFKPPSLVTEGLTGIAGRVWIDANTHCVSRIQGRILHPVDFGWGGMLARVGEGGTVEFEQQQVSENRWLYSHLSEHLTLREMLIHTVSEDVQSDAWDAHPLPAPLSVQDAIRELLASPVATR